MGTATEHYFDIYNDYFWQWEEDGTLLTIPVNGSTIAYRAFVVEVMELLKDQGLPPFGTLLLAIIATNQQGYESIKMIENKLISLLTQRTDIKYLNQDILKKGFNFLYQLSKLPMEYKEGEKRILLFHTIFSKSHNRLSIKDSKLLVKKIKNKYSSIVNTIGRPIVEQVLNKDIRVLTLLNDRYPTVDWIIESIASIPENVDLELEETIKEGDLISELISEPKTFHIGSLIKKIWGGLNIPMHHMAISQQPLGGVSDIANKGDFDKLLISEFANDDIIFLSRLANNEALYINREVPPQNDNFNRYILVDISLRNWGTSKTIAYAIMLALANHPKSKMKYEVYLVGDSYHRVDFGSLADIIDMQRYVDSCLSPNKGLTSFFNECTIQGSEVIFITNEDVMQYSDMKLFINEYRHKIDYVIYTDSIGRIDVYRMLKNSSKHLQSLSLNLADIWTKEENKKSVKLVEPDASELHPFTLLLSPRYPCDGSMMKQENNYYFYRKGIFLKQVSPNKGCQILYNDFGKNVSQCIVGYNEDKQLMLLICYDSYKELKLHNLVTGEKKSYHFPRRINFVGMRMYFYENYFYAFLKKDDVISCYSISLYLNIDQVTDTYLIDQINALKDKEIEEYNFRETKIYASILLKIKMIAIGHDNSLIINGKFRLVVENSHLFIRPFKVSEDQVKEFATYYADSNEFSFKNGVRVKLVFEILIITLKDNRKIEIPLFIDQSLAMAVDNVASGNPYFYTDNASSKNKAKDSKVDKEMLDLLTDHDTWS